MKTKYYSGIGSRETPESILDDMIAIGAWLASNNYTLRSGNARGADTAFQQGCDMVDGESEIFLPYAGFNNGCRNSILVTNARILKQSKEIMKSLKSATYTWNSINTRYHIRNVFQVIGVNLNTPSSFVICYTDTGAESANEVILRNDTSGTSTAITLASKLNIPVINMYNESSFTRIRSLFDNSNASNI